MRNAELKTLDAGGDGRLLDRRSLLARAGGGFGLFALSALAAEQTTGLKNESALRIRTPHSPSPRDIRYQIFCPGGMSQVDTFDYKPELKRRAGTVFDPTGKLQFFGSKPGKCLAPFWNFRQHGECGRWMADLFRMSGRARRHCVRPSMQQDRIARSRAASMNTGRCEAFEHGFVGAVRTGQRVRQPAGLRRPA